MTCGCPKGYIQEGIPCGCCGAQATVVCDVFFMCEECRVKRDVGMENCELVVNGLTPVEQVIAELKLDDDEAVRRLRREV